MIALNEIFFEIQVFLSQSKIREFQNIDINSTHLLYRDKKLKSVHKHDTF